MTSGKIVGFRSNFVLFLLKVGKTSLFFYILLSVCHSHQMATNWLARYINQKTLTISYKFDSKLSKKLLRLRDIKLVAKPLELNQVIRVLGPSDLCSMKIAQGRRRTKPLGFGNNSVKGCCVVRITTTLCQNQYQNRGQNHGQNQIMSEPGSEPHCVRTMVRTMVRTTLCRNHGHNAHRTPVSQHAEQTHVVHIHVIAFSHTYWIQRRFLSNFNLY